MKRVLGAALALVLVAPVAAMAQRTSVSRDVPIYSNGGYPDLSSDPKRFVSQMEIVDRLFEDGDCELVEGSVGGPGYRRLLRFDTVLINSGDGDLKIGSPTDPNNPYAGASGARIAVIQPHRMLRFGKEQPPFGENADNARNAGGQRARRTGQSKTYPDERQRD